jgi:single-strand DNA-binding protein
MNEIQVTIRGNITSEPRQVRFDDGNIVTSFRVASNARRYDGQTRQWVNAGTTFVNVNCRRGMAVNVANSLSKGQPVLVTGKLRERAWEKDGRSGRSLEIEADGLGHDLAWGTSEFTRVVRVETLQSNAERQAEEMAYRLSQDDGELDDELDGAELDGAELDGAELDGAELDGAELRAVAVPA